MQSPQFKKQQTVKFNTAAVKDGAGVVTGIRKTEKGLWYEVTDRRAGRVYNLRAAALVAA